ncbi:hypothetical protein [Methanothrix soehngenii]|uniref:hypothetical protein n=1 Tax=Methanothrix soehngenii TaxID=2223 RepID=UPI002FDF7207
MRSTRTHRRGSVGSLRSIGMDDYSWWWAADALCDEWAELKAMGPEERRRYCGGDGKR